MSLITPHETKILPPGIDVVDPIKTQGDKRRKKLKATCHPAQPNQSNGLCKACYQQEYNKVRSSTKKPATCHPERTRYVRTICRPCYEQDLKNFLQQNASPNLSAEPLEPTKGECRNCEKCRKAAFWQERNNQYFCAYCRWVGGTRGHVQKAVEAVMQIDG